jgi:cellulose synthase/poly-beta-1,6-N-acetylglucosamine synthase-like glycosyltransferase
MELIFPLFFLGLMASSLVQAGAVGAFLPVFDPGKIKVHRKDFSPRVLVLMSLKGADPTLAKCLKGILNQDYPCYDLHIIIDSEKDPAWEVVQKIISDQHSPRVTVSPLIKKRRTAGLKNSALLQVLENLPDPYEVVAQLDSDVIPHRQWLKELVAPLESPEVGATMGNRWFVPTKGNWGSMVQYIWNAYSVPFMYFKSIPWAGTFAMKSEVIKKTDALKWLGISIIEDNVFFRAIQSLGLKLEFVPSLMMVQKINDPLIKVMDFYKRQLLWTRLYHPQWVSTAFLSWINIFLTAGATLLFFFSLVSARWTGALWTGAGLTILILVNLFLFALIDSKIHTILRKRGQTKESWFQPLFIFAVPFSQLVIAICLGLATFSRKVIWRGTTYRIDGPWQIHRMPEADEKI